MNGTMDGEDRLEQLKEQVRQASYQEYRVQKTREDNHYRKNAVLSKQKDIEGKMESFVREIFFKNEIANREERALLSDQIEHFAFNQQDMKEQIIKLNDYITSPNVLEGIYEEKRKQLEEHYLEVKQRLDNQIGYIEHQLKERQWRLNQVQESVKKLEEKEKELKGEIDKKTILNKIFKPGIFFIVGLIDYFSGYYITLTIWTVLKQCFDWFHKLF